MTKAKKKLREFLMFDCSKVCPKKCKADCCGYVPMEKEFWEKHKHKAQVEVKVLKWSTGHVIPLTKNLACCFLDKDYRCVIYEDRPIVCRLFGTKNVKGLRCPYLKPNGYKRGKKERLKLVGENNENMVRIAKRINKALELLSKGKSTKEIAKITRRIK